MPFELKRPDAQTPVTQAENIGYGNIDVKAGLDFLNAEIGSGQSVEVKDDFTIVGAYMPQLNVEATNARSVNVELNAGDKITAHTRTNKNLYFVEIKNGSTVRTTRMTESSEWDYVDYEYTASEAITVGFTAWAFESYPDQYYTLETAASHDSIDVMRAKINALNTDVPAIHAEVEGLSGSVYGGSLEYHLNEKAKQVKIGAGAGDTITFIVSTANSGSWIQIQARDANNNILGTNGVNYTTINNMVANQDYTVQLIVPEGFDHYFFNLKTEDTYSTDVEIELVGTNEKISTLRTQEASTATSLALLDKQINGLSTEYHLSAKSTILRPALNVGDKIHFVVSNDNAGWMQIQARDAENHILGTDGVNYVTINPMVAEQEYARDLIVPEGFDHYFFNLSTNDSYSADVELSAEGALEKIEQDISDVAPKQYVVDINGSGDYTSVTACFRALASDNSKKEIIIRSGTYDIFEELGGVAYLNTINPATANWRDVQPVVPPNSKVRGLGNVTLDYSPTDEEMPSTDMAYLFSPLNVSGNCEIENLTITCKNCRYGIHGESSGRAEYSEVRQKFTNLRVFHNAGGKQTLKQAMACGIGGRSYWEFNSCQFYSEGGEVWYVHSNSNTQTDCATIIFNDCVFDRIDKSAATQISQIMSFVSGHQVLHNYVYMNTCYVGGKIGIKNGGQSTQHNSFDVKAVGGANNGFIVDGTFATNDYPPQALAVLGLS